MTEGIAWNRMNDTLRRLGEPIRYRGGTMRTRGRCHDGDADDTVAISRGDNGALVVFCHKCGGNADFLASIGWTEADLYDEPLPEQDRRDRPADDTWIPCQDRGHKRVAQYLYRDEQGSLVHGVTRCSEKCFAQWRPDDTTRSGRRWSLNDKAGNRLVRTVPYLLPELLKAKADDRVIWIAEGEKDVHALMGRGLAATCNAAGSGRWTAEHAAYFEGADVTIVADRDAKGREHAEQVVATLLGLARSVYVVQAKSGKDAADHFAAGHNDTEFIQVWVPKPYPGDPAGAQ
ncbi:toprim domain-containing protein [Streptomyces sp. NPDC087422]|uniref:toprim domain-containing protein n=1 Tax=Streptomyces sp. NPDC087422 TaxID=3365786 RepID=UPI00382F5E23